jgi:hypothetical protein
MQYNVINVNQGQLSIETVHLSRIRKHQNHIRGIELLQSHGLEGPQNEHGHSMK